MESKAELAGHRPLASLAVLWCCFCSTVRQAPAPRNFTGSDRYAGNGYRQCLEKQLTWRRLWEPVERFWVFDSVTTPLGPDRRAPTELFIETLSHRDLKRPGYFLAGFWVENCQGWGEVLVRFESSPKY